MQETYYHDTTPEQDDYNAYLSSRPKDPVPVSSKVDLLAKRKEEKVNNLSALGRQGLQDTDLNSEAKVDGMWMGNKVLNEYNPAELMYLQGRMYDELGYFKGEDGYFTRVGGELVPTDVEDRDLGTVYMYGTGQEDVAKTGLWNMDTNPERRYIRESDPTNKSVDRYGKPVGPIGVDRDKSLMELYLDKDVAQLNEALIHGNKYVLSNRADAASGDPAQFRRDFGTGSTEAYTSGDTYSGMYGGDSRQYELGDKEALWSAFAQKYGLDKRIAQRQGAVVSAPTQSSPKVLTVEEVRDLNRHARMETMSPTGRVMYEAGQVLSAAPAQVFKGGINLVDAALEGVTYAPQELWNAAVRMYTGNEDYRYDIDLLPDDVKESVTGMVDSLVGYERAADEETFQKLAELGKKTGIDFTDPSSVSRAFENEESRDALVDMVLEVGINPSLVIGALAEVLGAGGALKLGVTVLGKLGSKVLPNITDKVSNAVKTNNTKIKEQIAVLNRSGVDDAVKAAKTKELLASYNLGKRIPDLFKGGPLAVTANADMMVRMNEDVTQFMENNGGEEPPVGKLIEIATLNRIASVLQGGAIGYTLKVGEIGKEAAKEGVLNVIKDISAHMTKSGVLEGGQEILDGVVQQINQKLDSKKYEDYTLKEIIEETSGDILAGGMVGVAAGAEIGGITQAWESGVVGKAGELINTGLDKVANLKDALAGVTSAVNDISNDVKDAFGGDEVVQTTLKGVGATPAARQQAVDTAITSYEGSAGDAAKQVVANLNSLIMDELPPDNTISEVSAPALAEALIVDIMSEMEATRSVLTDQGRLGEIEQTVQNVMNQKMGAVASSLAIMRAGGREQEAALLSRELLRLMPSNVQYFGSDPDALERFTSTVVREAVSLGNNLKPEDVAAVMSAVRKVANISPERIADIEESIKTAIEVGKAYKKVKDAKLTTSEVGVDSAVGDRGFLTYFDRYTDAVDRNDTPMALASKERLTNFQKLMKVKLDNLEAATGKMEAKVNSVLAGYTASKPKATPNDMRAELGRVLGRGKDVTVKYGTGSGGTFIVRYWDVIDNVVEGDRRKGVYKVIDNLKTEIEAMETLIGYADSKVTGKAKAVTPTETTPEVIQEESTYVESEVATPVEPAVESVGYTTEDTYSGTYRNPEQKFTYEANRVGENLWKVDRIGKDGEVQASKDFTGEQMENTFYKKGTKWAKEDTDQFANLDLSTVFVDPNESITESDFETFIPPVDTYADMMDTMVSQEAPTEGVIDTPVTKEPKVNAVKERLRKVNEAKRAAIKEAKEARKAIADSAWKKLKDSGAYRVFLNEFNNALGDTKSVLGLLSLIEKDTTSYGQLLTEATGNKLNGKPNESVKKTDAQEVYNSVSKVLASVKKELKDCK